jgi:hypothetical protein
MKTKRRNTIDVNNLHKILAHCVEVIARLTYDYEITGKFNVCERRKFNPWRAFVC